MTLLEWQKRITHRVFVDSDGLNMGELMELLDEMWADANADGYAESVNES